MNKLILSILLIFVSCSTTEDLTIKKEINASCPDLLVQDISKDKWTKHDTAQVKRLSKRCPEVYPKSPCLVYFLKKEYHTYHALCGGLQ
jgi:hypothetical protein